MATTPLIEHPPPPAGGNGTIIDVAGSVAVELTWGNGKLTKVAPVTESLNEMADLKLTNVGGSSSPPLCWKCLLDANGNIIQCWFVPC